MRAKRQTPRLASSLVIALATASAASCGDDFDPYNLVGGEFRILAVRADPPWIAAGGRAVIEPLIYVEGGGAAPDLDWSWCPAPANGECAVSAEQIGEALGVPGFSFDLGQASTASFSYPGSSADTAALCESLLAGEWPPFLERPDCDAGIGVSIVLDASTPTREETALKELRLSSGDAIHSNPELAGLAFVEDEIESVLDPESWIDLDPVDPPTLELGVSYRLVADVPDSAAEPYVDDETGDAVFEPLVLTWFVTTGETDDTRTRWYVDAPELSGRSTLWTLPDAEDFTGSQARIFVVVRDDRGGIGWLERQVLLASGEQG